MSFMFPLFDWLCDRGWLSTRGTPWDYFMVICVIPAPMFFLIAIAAYFFGQ